MKPIAYLILAHTDPAHLRRLTERLRGDSQVFVHVDAKSDIEPFMQLRWGDHVHFVERRVSVRWAGYSMIEATLVLVEAALERAGDFCHAVLLSGLDYPLRSQPDIVHFLNAHAGHEFIRYIDMRESPEHYLPHIERKHFRDYPILAPTRLGVLPGKVLMKALAAMRLRNDWDDAVVPYFGSQWWALTRPCLSYALEFMRNNPRFIAMNRQSFSPDEHFFHTLVGNSPFAVHADGVQPFEGRGTWRMANLHLVHHSLAKTYRLEDLDEVLASERLFVRKVTSRDSGPLLDRLDRMTTGGAA